MELRVLRYFLAVAREESISGAAELLHITQPTLSRQLMELEDELGAQLLIRGNRNRRVTLTEEGMLLRRRAEELVSLADRTQAEFALHSAAVAGDVSIGAGETEGMRILARVASDLRVSHPQISFHLYSGNAEDVIERLDKGLLDFGVLIGPANLAKYDCLRLPACDTWGVLMRRDSPLAARESVSPQDLWDAPLLVSQQSIHHGEFSSWLGRDVRSMTVAATYTRIYNAALMVEAGMGYALALAGLVHADVDGPLCFRPLRPRLEGQLHMVWKRGVVFSRAPELFLRELRAKIAAEGAASPK